MRVVRRSVVGMAMLVLAGGLGGVAGAQSDESEAPVFPTGTFITAEWGNRILEFDEDGTLRVTQVPMRAEGTYAVDGDLYEQTSFNFVGEDPERLPPATYRWLFDGEHLTFEVVGEDPDRNRRAAYTEQPYRYVPDARLAVVAAFDIKAGTTLIAAHTELWAVPSPQVPVGTLTNPGAVIGATTTAAITKGQPITPDLLEPPAE